MEGGHEGVKIVEIHASFHYQLINMSKMKNRDTKYGWVIPKFMYNKIKRARN
jgi:hypothetical protein